MKLKHAIQRTLMWPPINTVLTSTIKPVVNSLPIGLVAKIPVAGKFNCPLPNGKIIKFDSDGLDKIAATMYWYGIDGLEGETTRLFLRLLPGTKTFLDIGANIGIYALMAGVTSPDCVTYAFEPVPSVYERLRENTAINQLTNVHAIHAAVTNFDGETSLYVEIGLRLPLGASIKKQDRDDLAAPITVPAVTVDSVVVDRSIERVDLMKIDTETTEPAVLMGALNTVDRDRPVIICEVQHGQTELELESLLSTREYGYYMITSDGLVSQEHIVGDKLEINNNYVFIPNEKYQSLVTRLT